MLKVFYRERDVGSGERFYDVEDTFLLHMC